MAEVQELDVSSWAPIQLEARGSGPNLWLADLSGVRWLYKETRVPNGSSEAQGEDWAEKLAERLAQLVGLPCAQVELAFRTANGLREVGVVSRDLTAGRAELQNGAVLLGDIDGYRYREEVDGRLRPPRNHVGHSVENVVAKLDSWDVAPPVGFDLPGLTAAQVFAGYLVLDAWIANLDRHEENWAVLQDADGTLSLAPTYDHGAALGSSLTEGRRHRLTSAPAQLAEFAERAYGKKFEDGRRIPLTQFAARALDLVGPAARAHWLERLSDLLPDDVEKAVAEIPRMSDPARSFCSQLLAINRRRVLDVCR